MTEEDTAPPAPPPATRLRRRLGSRAAIAVATGAAGLLIGGLVGAVFFGGEPDHVRAAPAADTVQSTSGGGNGVEHESSCGRVQAQARHHGESSVGDADDITDPHHDAPSPRPAPPA